MSTAVTILLSLVGFFLMLGPLIFVHEFGHFLVAKWMDIHVVRFSLGFPPKAFGIQWGETEYCLSWLPWGGYVKMGGDMPGDPTTDPRGYLAKPVHKRLPVILAGVIMNFLAAWGLLTFLAWHGVVIETTDTTVRVEEKSVGYAAGLRTGDKIVTLNGAPVADFYALRNAASDAGLKNASQPFLVVAERAGQQMTFTYKPDLRVKASVWDLGFEEPLPAVIGTVTHGFPAYQAGLTAGDRIVSINGRQVEWFSELTSTIHESIEKPVTLVILRGGQEKTVELIPKAQKFGGRRIGMIGITPPYTKSHMESRGLIESFEGGLDGAIGFAAGTFGVLGSLIRREQDVGTTLGGPIAIAAMAGDAIRSGLHVVLERLAQLSVGLAVLNILPIAPLDGGHLFVLIIEGIRRRPLPLRLQAMIQNAGVILVLGLLVVIVYSDISKIVHRFLFPQIQ